MENRSLRLRKTSGQYSLNLKWLGMFSLWKKKKVQKQITNKIKQINNKIIPLSSVI